MTAKHVVARIAALGGGVLLVAGSAPVLFVSLGAGLVDAAWIAALALALAVVVLLAAVFLATRPKEHRRWGLVILALSLVRIAWLPTLVFLFLSGFVVGMLLGVVGGLLGIVDEPVESARA